MRWTTQLMYVRRDTHGVIVGISEAKPDGYMSTHEQRLQKAYRATDEAELQIKEYAKRKMAEKKKRMGK